jgi:hypothetical protein
MEILEIEIYCSKCDEELLTSHTRTNNDKGKIKYYILPHPCKSKTKENLKLKAELESSREYQRVVDREGL